MAAGLAGIGIGAALPSLLRGGTAVADECPPGTTTTTTTTTAPPIAHPISGNFAGTIPSGEVWTIVGDVNLTGDLIVEGVLTHLGPFALTGNGFQILVQNGGVLNLQGAVRSGWVRWGDAVTGWQANDRLIVAPTGVGKFTPVAATWPGAWSSLARPADSPDVALSDGSTARPEVANLTRSVTLTGLSRIHFHDGAGVQTLKHVAVVNSGVAGVLAQYPIHFHLNGLASSGSVLEGVVVEGGKNHAFVPHASHGITFIDCVSHDTTDSAYWWDPSITPADTTNDTNDVVWSHCLASLTRHVSGSAGLTTAGFNLGAGLRNSCVNSVAFAGTGIVQDAVGKAGFRWPEDGYRGPWTFTNCVAHNNTEVGINVWQNNRDVHLLSDFVGYRNGRKGIAHGAYQSCYHYDGAVLTGNGGATFGPVALDMTAQSPDNPGQYLIFEDIKSDGILVSGHHVVAPAPDRNYVLVKRCTFSGIKYNETGLGSRIRYEDCNLTPANFTMTSIKSTTSIDIYEAGVRTYHWTAGSGAWANG